MDYRILEMTAPPEVVRKARDFIEKDAVLDAWEEHLEGDRAILRFLLGAGFYTLAVGSIILTLTNMICINLAGVFTFLVQGIRPRTWWEAEKAKKAARKAIALWIVLLIILATIIVFWN